MFWTLQKMAIVRKQLRDVTRCDRSGYPIAKQNHALIAAPTSTRNLALPHFYRAFNVLYRL
jgi:hypothetical protein